MPGPGEYVSDGTTWRPAERMLRYPSGSKNGEIPGDLVLGADGKPILAPDPAAVSAIKKELGFRDEDVVPIEKLFVSAIKWQSNKTSNVVDAVDRLIAALSARQSGLPVLDGGTQNKIAMLDSLMEDPEIMEIIKKKMGGEASLAMEETPRLVVAPLAPEGTKPARRGRPVSVGSDS